MCQVVALKHYDAISSKSGHNCLPEVVVYKRFQIWEFDWESFAVLDRWPVAYGRWLLMRGSRTWRFNCISKS